MNRKTAKKLFVTLSDCIALLNCNADQLCDSGAPGILLQITTV
uniref:Uncharacterized protein n=1 Tax=Anguilla anguilla TaxID=7936 RepID=A0A0E9VL48_ANGAN